MIRILKRNEIDTKRWDHCVKISPESRIFGFSWYLDCCCDDWFGIVKGDYDAVFPLAKGKKYGVEYCYQPFFTRYCGLYSKEETTAIERKIFLDIIPSKIRFLEFALHESFSEFPEGAKTSKKVYQQIDLNRDYAAIHERYHENLNRTLRKAEKKEFTILPDYNPDEVVDQFKIHQKQKKLGFGDGDFQQLKKLMKAVAVNATSYCIAVVSAKGEVLSGAFFMESGNRITYLKGFSTEEGKQSGSMHFLIDRLIRSKAGLPVVFDFGGSNSPSVARFFRSFGAEDCLYLHLVVNRLPRLFRWLKR